GERRLRLPEPREQLGVDAVSVARFWVDAVPKALPVILGRSGDAVAVVTEAHLLRGFELVQRFLHGCELPVGIDARVERRSDVLGAAVDTLDVLEETDDLRDGLRERM